MRKFQFDRMICYLIFSWKGVFSDLDSGINYYMWSIGSEPGYTDMMPYMKVVDEECGITDKNNPLDLQDGHYYYINVRVSFKVKLSIKKYWMTDEINPVDIQNSHCHVTFRGSH